MENPAANSASTAGVAAYAPYDPYFIQTTFEIIHPELVLDRVNDDLQLSHKWAKKHGKPEALSSTEVRELRDGALCCESRKKHPIHRHYRLQQ